MTDDAFEDEIRQLLASGNKIEAIKRYREETGTDLAEAKAAVEAMTFGEGSGSRLPPDDPELMDEVVNLLGEGKPLPAIKLVRERTGMGLKESKELVDRIGEDNGILTQSGSGCLGIILIGAAVPLAVMRWVIFA